jgi:hypothetical protein
MRTTYLADLVIRDTKDDPLAVIDVVNFPGFSREEAIELRQRLIDYGLPAQIPYFLLLTQDIGFLWKDTKRDQLDVPPNYEFPMDGLVRRYGKDGSQRRLYRWELEWLILRWFAHLRASSEPDTEEPELTLVRSGLRELITDVSLLPDEEI